MSRAQGQFTIIDYNDALTLTGYIGSNHPKTQMYNPDNGSYSPNWQSSNLVLTPSLYVIGTTTDQITASAVKSVKWYQGTSTTAITTGGNYALSGTKNHILTVKANIMAGLSGVDFKCVITYEDDSTGLEITHPLTISFSRVVNGGGIVDLLVTTPSGNVFKNNDVATLTAKAELWRGSSIDTTNVGYKWAIMDPSVTSSSSTGYDADFGIGWKKLSDTTGKYTGTTTATITIYAAAVDSYAVFKCCATDTDSASNTYASTIQHGSYGSYRISIDGDQITWYYGSTYLGELESYSSGYVDVQGTWKTNGNNWISSSDRRVKKDIVNFDDRYEILFNKLKPRNYKYVDGNKGRVHSGFIAQEVTAAIEEAKMTLDEVAYVCAFENKDGETYYGLRYEELIAINTWQIQKLKERIKQLEDKLL